LATVDVQAGSRPSFVVHVYGIGAGGDIWHVDMFKIRKSERLDEDGERHLINPAAYPEDWQVLVDQVIEKSYPLADGSGRRMMIKASACDSGGAAGVTTNAYNFWRWLRDEHEAGHFRRFHLVKGEPSKSAPRVRVSYPDTDRKDRNSGARGDVPVIFINTNLVKDQVAAMLGREDTGELRSAPGFGMIHYPDWAEDWLYTQLTAEIRTAKGWDNPRGKRNEAFDLLVYCVALTIEPSRVGIRLERIDWDRPPTWALDWDENDLVFGNLEVRPFEQPRKKVDLAALAKALA
jgi:phage terminase large subunit GpA-like protein